MSIKNKHREKNESLIMGMEAGHLMEDAEIWWNSVGSEKMRARSFSGSLKAQAEALNATNPLHPNFIGGKSGILLGLRFNELTPHERYKVVHAYTLTQSGYTMEIRD